MAKHNPQACRLALSIVKDNFGDVCAVVYENLLRVGPQTLRELLLRTEFPHLAASIPRARRRETDRLVRAALQVLIQQNIISSHLIEPEPSRTNLSPESYQMYSAKPDSAIRCLAMPHYLQHIQDRYSTQEDEDAGLLHEAIVAALLEHGRLTLDQIVSAVVEKLDTVEEDLQQKIRDKFAVLLLDHYLERAAPCTLPPPPPPIFAKTGGKRVAVAKPGSEAAKKVEDEKVRQQPAVAYRLTRHKLPRELTSLEPAKVPVKKEASPGEGSEPAAPAPKSLKRKRKVPGPGGRVISNAARKSETPPPKPEPDVKPAIEEEEKGPILWRACHDTFLRQLRFAACADHMERKCGELAGLVVRAILVSQPPAPSDAAAREKSSTAVTVQEIRDALQRLPDLAEGFELPDDFPAILQGLSDRDPRLLIQCLKGGQTAYSLDLHSIIEEAKLKELQAHICRRFGHNGLRVWNCLIEFKQMETRTIQERAKLPHFDVRSVLYSLARANFVGIQDIPKTNDHAVTKTFHTLKVDLQVASEQLLTNMVKAACNLRERLNTELAKRKHVLQDMERGDQTVVERYPQEVREIQCIVSQLDCVLLGLVPSMLLFSDF